MSSNSNSATDEKTEEPLSEKNENNTEISLTLKKPKRLIYCSDGVIEEYSDDENEDKSRVSQHFDLENSQRTWLTNTAIRSAKTALGVCDYLGGSFASFFGIISPKFKYQIEPEPSPMEPSKQELGWMPEKSEVRIFTQPKSDRAP